MFRTIIFIFLFFILVACKEESETASNFSYKITASNDRKAIAIDDSVRYISLRSGFYRDADTSFFYYTDKNAVLIIDFEKEKVVKKIYIPKSGPNSVSDFSDVSFLSPYELIAGGSLLQKLFFCSIKDDFKVERVYDYKHLADSISVLDFGIQGARVHQENEYLFFVTSSPYFSVQFWNEATKFKDFHSKGFFTARYSRKKNVLEVLPILIPENYFEEGFQLLSDAISVAKRKDKFYYGFKTSHKIGVTDLQHKKIDFKDAKSQFVTLQGMPLNDIKAGMKFSAEKGAYQNLIYDEFRDIFYRIAQVNDEIRDEENPGDLFQTPLRFSIMLLSPDLKILAEELLPRGKFSPTNFFVDKEGLWLSENHPLNRDFDEDSLRFRCFKTEKR